MSYLPSGDASLTDIYTSQIVLDEAALGDSEIAAQRLQMLQVITLLEPSQRVHPSFYFLTR